ncbi:hypothetical protein BDZ94DRAFT_1311261 [Collybia nuda]|uniref:Uncharacterized protein n=1 Tax=Collybia nuda TaxID=64659 RepID=A0A9P6CG09_9AGAR|nr:hypothetical protein BDZ94DRAFT_1311261 [Collybia nuda]
MSQQLVGARQTAQQRRRNICLLGVIIATFNGIMETRHLPLRILYTINSSPQYILARSHSPIIATIIPRNSDSSHCNRSVNAPGSSKLEPSCATTSLKACLDTICRSSPELVQDFSRDFSVYVLDPLESNSAPAPVHISNASPSPSSQGSHTTNGPINNQPRGVAVGLGLMSWALLADEADSAAVAGTLITLPTGKEALEIIFALRETATMQKSSLPAALRSWGLPPQPPKLSRASKSRESNRPPKQCTTTDGETMSPRFTLLGQNTGTSLREESTHNVLGYPDMTGPSTSTPAASQSLRDTPGPFSASTLATLASIRMRTQTAKPLKPRRAPVTPLLRPASEADKMMLTKDIYIGPVKKKGRPAKGPISITDNETDSCPIFPESTSSLNSHVPVTNGINTKEMRNLPTPSQSLDSGPNATPNEPDTIFPDPSSEIAKCKTKTSKKCLKQDTSLTAPPTPFLKPSDSTSLLDIILHFSTSSKSKLPNTQNAALLSVLSTIDAGRSNSHQNSDVMDNPALVNALRDLISAVSSQAAGSSLSNSSSQTVHRRSNSQDDEIVILDKENVNPSAFRRRAERDAKQISSDPLISSDGSVLTAQMSFPVSTPPVVRSNERPAPALSSLQNNTISVVEKRRKRTLSDFMDERESNRSGKSREREWAERRDAHRHTHSLKRNSSVDSSVSSMRHYSRLNSLDGLQRRDRSGTNSYYRTGYEPFTSPPRRVNANRTDVEGENTRLFMTSTRPSQIRASASSPVRPSSQAPKRKYVVPNWARTQTSTQPRLSEAAQRALEEADERKRGEKDIKRKTACRSEKEKSKRTVHNINPSRQVQEDGVFTHVHLSTVPQDNLRPPRPIAASEACPVFSLSSGMTSPSSTLTPELCLSESPPSTTTVPIPFTPPRKRPGTAHIPRDCHDSLFTPTPKYHNNSLGGSPLFSPFGTVVKGPTMPTKDVVVPKNISEWKSNNCNEGSNVNDKDIEDALNKELDSAFGELETSGSLPIINTNLESNKSHSTTPNETQSLQGQSEDEEGQGDSHSNHIKQHWAGLPPSSPPPPTSPILVPHGEELESDTRSDDDDDMELPVATSDAEEYYSSSEVMGGQNIPDLSSYTNDELTAYLSDNDFSLLFPVIDHPSLLDSTSSDMDVFDQFTNLNAQSNGSCGENKNMNVDTGLGSCFEGEVADFDFTQFWETFKPLVQDHMNGTDNHIVSQEVTRLEQLGKFDHARLAEDVQALFSGCLM